MPLDDQHDFPKYVLRLIGKGIGNLLGRVTVEVHIENKFNSRCFIRIDLKMAVFVVGISKQLRRKRDSVVKPHTQGCFHTSAAGVRFFLSHCCLKGKRHL